jgi:hypothetical protein
MGQIRSSESVGKLTKTSTTTLELAPSVLNIGAFQYRVSSALTLSLGVSGAGGLDAAISDGTYYVYAVLANGRPALVGSKNSSLPAGFSLGKFIGKFTVTSSLIVDIFSLDVVAVKSLSLGDGSSGAPSYNFTNDSDLGIFRPAPNELGLSTNGSERVRINSSGNVGIGTASPTSTLTVLGSFAHKYTAVTGATTLDGTHYYVSASGSSTYAITLPTAVGIQGRVYIIKSNMNSGVLLTVGTTSSQTIDGSTSMTLSRHSALHVISNGSNWEIY